MLDTLILVEMRTDDQVLIRPPIMYGDLIILSLAIS